MRPFLKWAGGKRQLLPVLIRHYPLSFSRYIEPFLGSGAVFFDLLNARMLDGKPALLADMNADLIGCYRALRSHTEEVIAYLSSLEAEHRRDGDVCYYDVRDRRFNPMRAALRQCARTDEYPPALAAMFIFLNRTGFNGLFRLNRSGAFNVPAGRYVEPRICDADHLRRVGAAMRSSTISIELAPFHETVSRAGAGDFVYCDPPYAPLSATASFAHYTAGGFSAFDQKRLQQAVIAACERGAHVVLSNSSAPEILRMYRAPDAVRAGLLVRRVPARRAINSRASSRGAVDELIVSNARAAALKSVRPHMVAARAASVPRRKTGSSG